jgi:hypothetical protein
MTRSFFVDSMLQQELQARGVDLLSGAGWPGGFRWEGESISPEKRELELWASGVAVLKQPLSNYPEQGPYPYAGFSFTDAADLLRQLDELGWGRLVTDSPG